MATLTYAYAESTAVVGPLSPSPEPHTWDLCEHHAEKITAPRGWELLHVNEVSIDADPPEPTGRHALRNAVPEPDSDEDLMALADAVLRSSGRVTGSLDEGSMDMDVSPKDPADPQVSNHPVFRMRRVAEHKSRRRAHLSVVRDDTQRNDTEE